MRTLVLLALAAGCLLCIGCEAGDGGGVIKPEPTKNPMAERAAKSGDGGSAVTAAGK